jgi:unsaturated rhamnogalacturonyl hydrolase
MAAQRSRRLAVLVAGLVGVGLVTVPPAMASPTSVTPTCSVTKDLLSADAYWVANGTDMAPPDWQNSAFHVGNLAMVRTIGSTNHITLPWAEANNYQLPADPPNQPFLAEDEAVGEAYLALYYYHPTPANLAPLRARVAAEVAGVAQGNNTYWNYVDALNLAMPSFAQLGVMDASQADLDTMHSLFDYAKDGVAGRGLFDQRLGLWWRDASDIGTGTFWSRGNGEALAGLAKVLAQLPATDPNRAEYLQVYRKMALTLLALQRPDGFWNVDLANPFDHPGPETSGTALITYGLAWGINNGVLPAWLYQPAVQRAWNALTTTALQPSGSVGYVQGPATGPDGSQPVTATDTSAYGVGEFLLAGQQMAILTPGCTQPAG